MKNLFVFIAVLFGAFVLTLLGGVVFSLYKIPTGKLICFISAAVFFTAFLCVVLIGFIWAKKSNPRQTDVNREDEKSDN
ncbi:MAG: hypothetical protein SPL13_00675 [Clostridia bacterium]|nr:hypothetical protein [Clostridia bacterium]